MERLSPLILHQTLQDAAMRDTTKAGSGWLSAAFLVVIAVFGIVLIGHAPKWPIYVTILSWMGFVFYRANRG
jgi:hypothetical protein